MDLGPKLHSCVNYGINDLIKLLYMLTMVKVLEPPVPTVKPFGNVIEFAVKCVQLFVDTAECFAAVVFEIAGRR